VFHIVDGRRRAEGGGGGEARYARRIFVIRDRRPIDTSGGPPLMTTCWRTLGGLKIRVPPVGRGWKEDRNTREMKGSRGKGEREKEREETSTRVLTAERKEDRSEPMMKKGTIEALFFARRSHPSRGCWRRSPGIIKEKEEREEAREIAREIFRAALVPSRESEGEGWPEERGEEGVRKERVRTSALGLINAVFLPFRFLARLGFADAPHRRRRRRRRRGNWNPSTLPPALHPPPILPPPAGVHPAHPHSSFACRAERASEQTSPRLRCRQPPAENPAPPPGPRDSPWI